MFNDKLKKVTAQIDEILRKDDFPDSVQPDFLRDAVRDYPERGGKRLRPALTLWTCGMLGGVPEDAEFAAAACEVWHNWTLVHDDVIDDDDMRRGLPSTHAALRRHGITRYHLDSGRATKFGIDMAILTGDIQQGWSVHLLNRSRERGVSAKIVSAMTSRLLELGNRELISGEALDVLFSYQPLEAVKAEEVEAMLSMKTGALLSLCAEMGAMIGLKIDDMEDRRVADAGKFARLAGLAFQLRDDWLGVFATESKLGKPVGSDISESKPTILLTTALQNLGANDAERLRSYIGRKSLDVEDLERVKMLIKKSEADQVVIEKAKNFATEAKKILESFPNNPHRENLGGWVDFLIGRDY